MSQFFASPPKPRELPEISQKVPVYKLLAPYFDKQDRLCEEGEYIQLKTEPNQYMEPLNALAEIEMRKLLSKLDNIAKGVIEKAEPVSLLEKYEQERALKMNAVDDSDEQEGPASANSFSREAPISTLGAKKYKVGEDEYVTDARMVDKSRRDHMAKMRKAAAAKRASKKVEDLA